MVYLKIILQMELNKMKQIFFLFSQITDFIDFDLLMFISMDTLNIFLRIERLVLE